MHVESDCMVGNDRDMGEVVKTMEGGAAAAVAAAAADADAVVAVCCCCCCW